MVIGNKNGTPYSKSGFFIKGEVKHLQLKDKSNSVSLIAVINEHS
jgi:hypothetical protein